MREFMFVRSLMFMQSSWASGSSCEWHDTNYRQSLTHSLKASFACSRRQNGWRVTWQCIALSLDWATALLDYCCCRLTSSRLSVYSRLLVACANTNASMSTRHGMTRAGTTHSPNLF